MGDIVEVYRSKKRFDVEKLKKEVENFRKDLSFKNGFHRHSIPLLMPEQVARDYKNFYQNVPYSNAVSSSPYLKGIFNSLKAPKASGRLLRRGPNSRYGLHDDGPDFSLARFQIPIVTPENAYLVTTDVDFNVFRELKDEETKMKLLFRKYSNRIRFDYLEPGYMYHFDVSKTHTLINLGSSERLTVCIELVKNAWTDKYVKNDFIPVKNTVKLSLNDVLGSRAEKGNGPNKKTLVAKYLSHLSASL
jgi:hypothetical protein